QVFQKSYYQNLAREEHLRRWELKADRGNIFIKERDGVVPLAVNSSVYNLSASPRDLTEDFGDLSSKLADITGEDKLKIKSLLDDNRKRGYVSLSKRLTREQAVKVNDLKIYGLFLESIPQREYPEGRLASHVLGFVNTEGEGQYGVEQFYNKDLAGRTGSLKALATADGAPLLLPGEEQTVEVPAEQGKDVVLSLDRGLQFHLEDMARSKRIEYKAKSVSVMIMKAETGKVLAMAGAPDYDPAEYFKAESNENFRNNNVSDAEELGSIIKVLTMAGAVNEGVVNKDSTYNNSGSVKVGDRIIKNATDGHTGVITMTDVIKYSLNTGVVHALKQLGGEGEINDQAKEKLYNYFADRFNLNSPTGIDVSGENPGLMYKPKDQEGNAVRYSNMTFGQGMQTSPIQAAAALSSIMNGGSYIRPSVVESIGGQELKPQIVKSDVVSKNTEDQVKHMMSQASYIPKREGYKIGAKTGTAQLLQDDGTYSQTRERGTAYGFIETGEGTYIVMVKVEDPALVHFAGTKTAIPILVDTMNWILDYYQPKKL
ncbi:MAG TPA: penicillin-binding transpeptidase domain-containing protein, partial [Candidatus Saccharimonadales bacterium]|nr:penicillin-binding transpeptidase domain-containing protein [Candidatus Saccharimonadales bacterium]